MPAMSHNKVHACTSTLETVHAMLEWMVHACSSTLGLPIQLHGPRQATTHTHAAGETTLQPQVCKTNGMHVALLLLVASQAFSTASARCSCLHGLMLTSTWDGMESHVHMDAQVMMPPHVNLHLRMHAMHGWHGFASKRHITLL